MSEDKFEEEPRGDFDVLAEWTVRRLRPIEAEGGEDYPEKVKRWVLYSLGLDKLHQDIYLYLEKKYRITSTDIAKEFQVSPNTARKYLDELHTVGLVDYVGREYHLTYESLSRAIELMLIPRVTDTLKTIARNASGEIGLTLTPSVGSTPREITVEQGVMVLNQKILDEWYRQGKKVHVKSYSRLTIAEDVDPQIFDAVIEKVEAMGRLHMPSKLYTALAHKIRSIGRVHITDEDE